MNIIEFKKQFPEVFNEIILEFANKKQHLEKLSIGTMDSLFHFADELHFKLLSAIDEEEETQRWEAEMHSSLDDPRHGQAEHINSENKRS